MYKELKSDENDYKNLDGKEPCCFSLFESYSCHTTIENFIGQSKTNENQYFDEQLW
jgi:hypothetical protein